MTALDSYSSDEEKLSAGMAALMQTPEISALAGQNSSYGQICAAAERYLTEQTESAAGEKLWAGRVLIALLLAGLLALAAAVLRLFGKAPKAAALLLALAALLSLVSAGLWKFLCPSLTALPFLAALILLVAALIAEPLLRSNK